MFYPSNAHTHSTFCDGKSTPEEMVLSAIRLGYTSLGFSGHSYLPFEDGPSQWSMTPENTLKYIREVTRLKEAYKDQISIHLGLELDSYSKVDLSPYEYIIGSVHSLIVPGTSDHLSYDSSPEEFSHLFDTVFDKDPIRLAEHYYTQVVDHARACRPDILGHFNLITKYNECLHLIDETDSRYKSIASQALLEAAGNSTCVEINTGAIGRGHASIPYPNFQMMKLLKEHSIPVILTCDCHNASLLSTGYDLALSMLKEAGFTSLLTLGSNNLFEEIPLKD